MSGIVDRVVVSPHLDDAVLSAWGALEGGAATVVTVFAGVPPSSASLSPWDRQGGTAGSAAEVVSRRRREDLLATSLSGASVLHLDFLDLPYREGPVAHGDLVTALRDAIDGCSEVWIPAGVGGHPDHVAAGLAAEEASRGHPNRVVFGEQPYASVVRRATGSLGPDGLRSEEFSAALAACSPLVPARKPQARRLSGGELRRKSAAVREYASQDAALQAAFPGLVATPESLDWEIWWPLAEDQTTPAAARPQHFQLSVLVRTRGDRPGPLAELLESLTHQSCRDFEVCLLGHNLTTSAEQRILAQVAALPSWLSSRITIRRVFGGGRSRPLNVGLSWATGTHVAVIDDDDLAGASWVSEFRRLASAAPGKVLRTRVVRTSARAPDFYFPEIFDFAEHMIGNQSPVCGLAFPLSDDARSQVRFDESLTVFEDWHLLMRCVQLFGIVSSPEVTSIYRDLGIGDDSRSVHGSTTFERDKEAVIDLLDSLPVTLEPGSFRRLRGMAIHARHLDEQADRNLVLQRELSSARVEAAAERATVARLVQRLEDLRPSGGVDA